VEVYGSAVGITRVFEFHGPHQLGVASAYSSTPEMNEMLGAELMVRS